ncbi:Mating factor alpha [Yarrowia sp. B02]|nr:Mating factor alpha [Yarrowia sp. B02]
MKFSTLALSLMAAIAMAAPTTPEGAEAAVVDAVPEVAPEAAVDAAPKLEDLPKELQGLPKGVLQNVLFSDDKERFFVIEDENGSRHVIVVDASKVGADASKVGADALAKREANPEAWRWFWLPGRGEPNWKRDAMPADVDNAKREASPEAWRWFWLPGRGEPNWKRDAMPEAEASPEAWRWFWLPGRGEPNW